MITTTIHLPDWLYAAWPWMCVVMAIGYGAVGVPFISSGLIGYAAWVTWQRLSY